MPYAPGQLSWLISPLENFRQEIESLVRVFAATTILRGVFLPKEKRISPRGPQPKVPRHQPITWRNVVSAFIYGDRRQQKRIEAWGKINQEIFKDLGARVTRLGGRRVKNRTRRTPSSVPAAGAV